MVRLLRCWCSTEEGSVVGVTLSREYSVSRKIISFSWAAMALVCALTSARCLTAQSVLPGKPKAAVQRAPEQAPSQRFSLKAAPIISLGTLNDALRDNAPRRGMLQVGVQRPVTGAMMATGAWQKNSDGTTVWRLALQSNDAVGIRVHFTNFSVGDGKVWVHDTASPPKQVFGPYSALGVHGNGDLWTEAVFADSVEVEYQPGSQVQSLRLASVPSCRDRTPVSFRGT